MMAAYRVYFRNQSGEILGREDFDAKDDRAAIIIAASVRDACADVCDSFELWQGSRQLDPLARGRVRGGAEKLNSRTQEAVIELEVRLRDSQWTIARSKVLLERTRRLADEASKHR